MSEPAAGQPAEPDVAALERDIERTRENLAQTVDQLAARLDVPSRVRKRAAVTRDDAVRRLRAVRERATDDDGRPTLPAAAVVAGSLVLLTLLVVLGVRRRRP